ncbi:MAG: hypothetical protein JXR91_08285 [Deltaproteobacteria bacterium]|nr:hypothetical protein [Deltaproteobacteria bacterium]
MLKLNNITFAVMVILLFTACGYTPVLLKSHTIKKISVPFVINGTSYNNISGDLTSLIRREIASSGIDVVSEKTSDSWFLEVKVVGITSKTDGVKIENNEELPADTIYKINTIVSVFDPEGNLVLNPVLVSTEGFTPVWDSLNSEQIETESSINSLLEKLAIRISQMVFDI